MTSCFRILALCATTLLLLTGLLPINPASTPAAHADSSHSSYCSQPSILSGNTYARVTLHPARSNRLRHGPGFAAPIVGHIPPGGVFYVAAGQSTGVCVDGLVWWLVTYNGHSGWTAQGSGNEYWVEPLSSGIPIYHPPVCTLSPRLHIGGQGQVTPGLANVVRTAPGTTASGANSQIIGRIPAGGIFTVLNGPACGPDGRYWWYVNYHGLIGWTAEGEGHTYWLTPIGTAPPVGVCTLAPRLVIGQSGQVTPGLSNVVRTAPGTTASGANSQVIGSIPAGGTFSVLNGPACGPDGRYWWYVNYNGLIGWTAEGEGQTYWLVPVHW